MYVFTLAFTLGVRLQRNLQKSVPCSGGLLVAGFLKQLIRYFMKEVWLTTLFVQLLESSEIIRFYLTLPEWPNDAPFGRCLLSKTQEMDIEKHGVT